MDLPSCQEKPQEKLSSSFRASPQPQPPFPPSGICRVSLGQPWGLEHWRNLLLVLKADRTQHQAPGPACPDLCTPGPSCVGKNVHTLHVHTHQDRPGRTTQEGEHQGLWSEGTGRLGRE